MKSFLLTIYLTIHSICYGIESPDSLLAIVKSQKEDSSLAKNCIKLAWQYYASGDSAQALFYLHKSATLSEKLHFNRGELDACSNLAMLHTVYAQPDSALHYLLGCLQKAKQFKEFSIAAKCCLNVASAYLNRADYVQSIRYYLNALGYFEQLKDETKIAMTDHCIGIAYYLLKNYPLSLQYYNKAIGIAQRLGKPESAGYSYNGVGVVYKDLQQYDTAMYYLEQARQLALKAGDKTLLSHSLSNLGEIGGIRNDYVRALDDLSQALKIQTEMNDQRGRAETQILMGQVYLKKQDFNEAVKSYGNAKELSLAGGFTDILKNAWKGLSGAYHGLHKNAEALTAYQQYSRINDSLYTSESTRQIADMQTKYNTEKKERENVLLQRENELKGLELTEQKRQKYMLALLFAFIIIFAGIFYNRYRLQQKNKFLQERELRAQAVFKAQEEEKEKLSKDLHDGVGSLLSLIKLNISALGPAMPAEEKMIAQTKELAGKAMREVRNVSHRLVPGLLATAGLQAALTELAEQVNASGALALQLQMGAGAVIPREAELNIFRMIQEAVNNILKHAEATTASIQLENKQDRLIVSVRDNGRGFNLADTTYRPGNGLQNLSNRASLLNGTVEVISSSGAGTLVIISLPLK